MTRTRSRKRSGQSRVVDALLEKGIGASALGLVLLLAPLFTGKSPVFASMASAMRPAGWAALGIGALLLLAHSLVKRRQSNLRAQAERHRRAAIQPHGARAEPAAVSVCDGLASTPDGLSATCAPAAPQPHLSGRPASAAVRPGRAPATEWSATVFASIEWRRFEAVCEAFFAQAGFETQAQSHGADGGVDIWLHSRHSTGPVSVVQCKHWHGKPVGVREMREFFGVMSSHRLARGTYATTSTYTADAQQFATSNGIHTLDGAGLLAMIAKRTPEQQQALLAVAYEGEYWRPTCASCGTKMVERTRSKDGSQFWGCASYPRCRHSQAMTS